MRCEFMDSTVLPIESMIPVIIEDIRNWFAENCPTGPAVLGISGGKDSTVVAKLLADALGSRRVIGVLMPNGTQVDIDDSYKVIKFLGIQNCEVNIQNITEGLYFDMERALGVPISPKAITNVPPRIRMTTLYAIAQTLGGVVVGTGNASEIYLGWFTKWGDGANDYNFLKDYTATEVIALGDALGLPYELVHKTPSDGLCGKSDEEKFGFTYQVLDDYIRGKAAPPNDIKVKIDQMHNSTAHKR